MPVLAIPEIIVALVAICIILGGIAIGKGLSKMIPSFPLIGSWVRSHFVSMFDEADRLAGAVLRPLCAALAICLQGTALSLWWALYWIDSVATSAIVGVALVSHAAETLYDRAISEAKSLYNSAVAVALRYANDAIHDAESLYNMAISHANTLYNSAVATAKADTNAAIKDAENLYNAAIAHANALVGPIERDINSIAHTLTGDISGAVAQLQAQVNSVAATAEHDLSVAISNAETEAKALSAAAASGVSSALNNVAADVLNPALHDIIPAVKTIAGAFPAAVTGALGIPAVSSLTKVSDIQAALSVLTATAAITATEVAECLTPNCSALQGLGNAFSDLEDTALWALLLALVVEAAKDPGGAVADMAGPLASTVSGTANSVLSMVGL